LKILRVLTRDDVRFATKHGGIVSYASSAEQNYYQVLSDSSVTFDTPLFTVKIGCISRDDTVIVFDLKQPFQDELMNAVLSDVVVLQDDFCAKVARIADRPYLRGMGVMYNGNRILHHKFLSFDAKTKGYLAYGHDVECMIVVHFLNLSAAVEAMALEDRVEEEMEQTTECITIRHDFTILHVKGIIQTHMNVDVRMLITMMTHEARELPDSTMLYEIPFGQKSCCIFDAHVVRI